MSATRDYKSLAIASKRLLTWVGDESGCTQIKGTLYVKKGAGWFDSFSLQASSYGSDFFYVNYGIIIPGLWLVYDDVANCGYTLKYRLESTDGQGFGCSSKSDIEQSSHQVFKALEEQAIPWFLQNERLSDIAELYFQSTKLNKSKLGDHRGYLGLAAANYGFILLKSGNASSAISWLNEAKRLFQQYDEPDDDDIENIRLIEIGIERAALA